MATVRKRGKKFYVIYTYFNEEGQKKQKWESFNTEKEANKRKLKVELAQIENTLHVPTELTLEEFFEQKYLVLYGKTSWRYSTYSTNVGIFNNHIIPYIGHKKLSSITPMMVEELYETLRKKKVSGVRAQNVSEDAIPCLSSTTIRYVHVLLKKLFTKAVQWRCITTNPVICDAPKARKVEQKIWNGENFYQALNDMSDDLLRLAIHITFAGALRAGEVVGLTWDCVDFENDEYKINKTMQRVTDDVFKLLPKDDLIQAFPKTVAKSNSVLVLKKPKTEDSNRINCITPQLKDDLLLRKQQVEKDRAYHGENYQDNNLVFCFEDGRPVEPRLCAKWFKVWQKKTGLDFENIAFHGIRHSSATYLLNISEFDVKTVQDITGHGTTAQLTDGYAHKTKGHKKLLMDKFSRDFYGVDFEEDEELAKKQSAEALLELMKNDPTMREKVLKALGA